MSEQLTKDQMIKLTDARLLALYKARKASFRKATEYGTSSESAVLKNYCDRIKVILDSRGNISNE